MNLAEIFERGVSRMAYFSVRVALAGFMIAMILSVGPENPFIGYTSLALMIVGVILDVLRLRNIGASQWLMFVRFVPWLGLLLSVYLQSAQTDWIETKRFDRSGLIIIGIHAAIVGVLFYLLHRSNALEIFSVGLN